MSIHSGQTLSHYRLVEKIGEGGMGVVWKAEDTILGRTVAVKVLPAVAACDEQRRKMFLEEARLASSVSEAHIVQVHDFGREGDLEFIVMEFVEGKPLSRLLKGRPLTPDRVAQIGEQVARALSRAHRKGLLHRDLKPSNILVTPDGDAKVLDFGLAALFTRHETTFAGGSDALSEADTLSARPQSAERAVAGTVPYMSPEQVRGDDLDARSDIFSLGVVLYEMTTGQRPFTGPTLPEVAKRIQESRPRPVRELVSDVPLDLERSIQKALSPRRGDRYQTMDDLAVDLKKLARDLESGFSPSYGQAGQARPPGRRMWRLALLAGATVLVVGGALLVLRPGRPASPPTRPAHERSEIAVLPFQNLSAEGPHAYFAEGLQDELLTQLAKVAALKVISRTSVMGYQGTSKPLKAIATELGVGSVVEGSVQVVGDRLRVNVQLIDAVTDKHLWAERYDRTLDDAFAIQSDVAQQIVAAVGAVLTRDEQESLAAAPTANAEAYRLYLQGRDYFRRPNLLQQDLEIAQQFFEQALALDPSFAHAHAGLAGVHGYMYSSRYDPSPARAARQREEAEAALRLAPDLPQAHIAMGWAHYAGRRDYSRALDEYAVALKGLPNHGDLWSIIGYAHRRLGHWNEAFAAFEKATQLNPRDAPQFWEIGRTYQFMRRYADAVREYDQAQSLAPDLHVAAIARGWAYIQWQGKLDTLRAVLSRLPKELELGPHGNIAAQRAALLLLERDADSLLKLLQSAGVDVFVGFDLFLPSALYAAWAHQLRDDHAAARAAFVASLVPLDSALSDLPDDWRVHAARGMALAGLGRRDEALREGKWLQQSAVHGEDAYLGPTVTEARARILAQAGDAGAALDEIERLLAGPSWLSVHTLRLDPRWDPIRDHPRFQALLAKHGAEAVQ